VTLGERGWCEGPRWREVRGRRDLGRLVILPRDLGVLEVCDDQA
jgi:hypothetical protein